ncbi:MAG: squalene/phytoene synthase family protein [Alphaproteobacteria bacterium]|jgi:phytoene synthase|nr:squalene/phytoene synthase family protein [Alphaproteobacteria bacterium]
MSPDSPDARLALAVDHAACRAIIRDGSKTFFAASLLLPAEVRTAACALYAFCRLADDAVDIDARRDAVDRLLDRLDRAYAGRPADIAADRAFADVVARYAVPRALPAALIEGLAWDAEGRRYDDLPALQAYGARVAGTVGAMMCLLMGRRDPQVIARACDLGVAMQLTNIARDVGEDAQNARLYLPRGWLVEAGIDPDAWLADPRPDPRIGRVVAAVLETADRLYRRAEPGIAHLPARCRPAIRAARLLYAEIGTEVARRGHDSVSGRAVVPAARKMALLARATAPLPGELVAPTQPALTETAFLVDAVGSAPAPPPTAPEPSFDDRVAWVCDLFERLERRDAMERARTGG